MYVYIYIIHNIYLDRGGKLLHFMLNDLLKRKSFDNEWILMGTDLGDG